LKSEVEIMQEIMGLAISNWAIWVTMAVFISGYFALTEFLNKKEENK